MGGWWSDQWSGFHTTPPGGPAPGKLKWKLLILGHGGKISVGGGLAAWLDKNHVTAAGNSGPLRGRHLDSRLK